MIEQLNSISLVWWDWMTAMFWQSSLLILIIAGIDYLIRRWVWPQVRYALWLLVLIKLVIPPGWSLDISLIPPAKEVVMNKIINVPDKSSSNEKSKSDNAVLPPGEIKDSAENKMVMKSEMTPEAENASPVSAAALSTQTYFMFVWILGAVIFSVLLLLRISKLRRWHREQEERKTVPPWFHELLVATAGKMHIERLPAIVFSNEAVTPAVYGVFRPVLLLPEKYVESLSPEEAEHVLLHELAHVKRGDLIIHGINLVLQIIYWFNPLLILVRKQLKHVREICCDLTIANILRDKTDKYRQTLLDTAREMLSESLEPGMGLLGLFEEPFKLITRLKWLEKKTWENRKAATAAALVTSFLVMAFIMPMGDINVLEQEMISSGDSNVPPIETIFDQTASSIPDKYLNEDNLKKEIQYLNSIVDRAYIDWDMDVIEKYYTRDAVIEHDLGPATNGIDELMAINRENMSAGLKFHSLSTKIIDFWTDNGMVYVVETFSFSISAPEMPMRYSGDGKSITIWVPGEGVPFKIKYSIMNTDLNPLFNFEY